MTIWQNNAARFATTREQRVEQELQAGVRRAKSYYAIGRRGWARGEWELVLLARKVARLTNDQVTLTELEDLHYVGPARVTAL